MDQKFQKMFKVICINASKLPPGATLEEGMTYFVESQFINSFDQVVYIIDGIQNSGKTKHDLPWVGYNSTRFMKLDDGTLQAQEVEYNYNLN